MIEIHPWDYLPMERFRLAWRITDVRWTKLPPDDLAEVRPLRPEKAAELKERSTLFFLAPYELDQRWFAGVRSTEAPAERVERTRGWLRDRNVDPGQTLLVLWDRETAVVTKWSVFLAYWSDFCYPSSDDVDIWPPSEEWILAYYHFEEFSFGQRRRFPTPPLSGEDPEE